VPGAEMTERTPRDVIHDVLDETWCEDETVDSYPMTDEILAALEAAGFVIVPKDEIQELKAELELWSYRFP